MVASVLLMIKFFQLLSLRFVRYFKDLSSFIAPVLYIGAIIFSATSNTPCLCIPDWQWQIGVVTIFAGWISLLFYLRRLPVLGIYIVMFFNICQNSLKVLGVLAILVVGCGLALNMLFYDDQHVGVSLECDQFHLAWDVTFVHMFVGTEATLSRPPAFNVYGDVTSAVRVRVHGPVQRGRYAHRRHPIQVHDLHCVDLRVDIYFHPDAQHDGKEVM